jgi:hypothetical protein
VSPKSETGDVALLKQLFPKPTLDSTFDLEENLQNILVDSCILANARSAKILVARSAAHADLTGEEFTMIISRSRDFIVQTEIIAGQMISPLRAALTIQVSRERVFKNYTWEY